MRAPRYLNAVLTVIAVLLLSISFNMRGRLQPSALQFARPAYAAETVGDWVFFPVGNQEVRRLVIWDRTSNTVYDYDTHGGLDNTWVIKAPGERIEKR